jgi:hypothetical protein
MTTDQMKIESVRLAIAMIGQGAAPHVILQTAEAIFVFISSGRTGP